MFFRAHLDKGGWEEVQELGGKQLKCRVAEGRVPPLSGSQLGLGRQRPLPFIHDSSQSSHFYTPLVCIHIRACVRTREPKHEAHASGSKQTQPWASSGSRPFICGPSKATLACFPSWPPSPPPSPGPQQRRGASSIAHLHQPVPVSTQKSLSLTHLTGSRKDSAFFNNKNKEEKSPWSTNPTAQTPLLDIFK